MLLASTSLSDADDYYLENRLQNDLTVSLKVHLDCEGVYNAVGCDLFIDKQ
jgi:hypothetical protein